MANNADVYSGSRSCFLLLVFFFFFSLSPRPPCSFPDAPINLGPNDFREAGRYLAWRGAPRCTPCRCPSSPELSRYRHGFFFFLFQTVFFSPLQRDTGGTSSLRKPHPCTDLPVLSAPLCTELRPFPGPRTLKNKTERNAG